MMTKYIRVTQYNNSMQLCALLPCPPHTLNFFSRLLATTTEAIFVQCTIAEKKIAVHGGMK